MARFQARLDAVAAELIAARAALAVVMSPHDAPSLFQYGAPAATVLAADGALDRAATLAALAAAGQARSLQGQLLTAGLEARALPIGVLREDGVAELEWVLGALGHEECDDGNAADGDGCDTNCTRTRCGNGIVTAGEVCDGGIAGGGNGCDATCTLGCPPVPPADCERAVSGPVGRLVLRASGRPEARQLSWRWATRASLPPTAFGDPTEDESYVLCVYDPTGLRFGALAPAGSTCPRAASCWRETPWGFAYQARAGRPDGLTRLRLASNPGGAPARLTAGGRGTRLALPPLATLASPVTVALRAGSGRCWAATYTAPFASHGPTVFRARAD